MLYRHDVSGLVLNAISQNLMSRYCKKGKGAIFSMKLREITPHMKKNAQILFTPYVTNCNWWAIDSIRKSMPYSTVFHFTP